MVQIKVYYDQVGNTLTVWFDNPEVEVEETGEEIVLMKNKDGAVIGFEKLNYSPVESAPMRVAFETVTV